MQEPAKANESEHAGHNAHSKKGRRRKEERERKRDRVAKYTIENGRRVDMALWSKVHIAA